MVLSGIPKHDPQHLLDSHDFKRYTESVLLSAPGQLNTRFGLRKTTPQINAAIRSADL